MRSRCAIPSGAISSPCQASENIKVVSIEEELLATSRCSLPYSQGVPNIFSYIPDIHLHYRRNCSIGLAKACGKSVILNILIEFLEISPKLRYAGAIIEDAKIGRASC